MNGRKAKALRRLARQLTTEQPDESATDFKFRRTVMGHNGPIPIVSATVHHVIGSYRYWCQRLKTKTPSKSDWRKDVIKN